jgi:hypothetical protein
VNFFAYWIFGRSHDQWINNKAIDKECEKINVLTQGKNYIALNTYVKNYVIKDFQN